MSDRKETTVSVIPTTASVVMSEAEKSAHEIWARMVFLWESRPAYEAVKEMACLMKKGGW